MRKATGINAKDSWSRLNRKICFLRPKEAAALFCFNVNGIEGFGQWTLVTIPISPQNKKGPFPELLETGPSQNRNYEASAATVVCSHACPVRQQDAVRTTTNGTRKNCHESQCRRPDEWLSSSSSEVPPGRNHPDERIKCPMRCPRMFQQTVTPNDFA